MERIYMSTVNDHFKQYRQMVFLSGPRQVGKTFISKSLDSEQMIYTNWDNQNDRLNITGGPELFAESYDLNSLESLKKLVVIDEIHKYRKWKQFLKGFFDSYGENLRILVTGSAKLNIYKKTGDSLMGRYFNYRLHPLSVGEILSNTPPEKEIRDPSKISDQTFSDLLEYGGFPEPFLKADKRFYNKWNRLRNEQFFQDDLREITNINEISLIETFAEIIKYQSGQLLNYSSIAKDINISADTVKRWLNILENMYYCFRVKPYFKNIPKSIRKQPKVFLWDWSLVSDPGQRAENMVASHLLKAVHFWTDTGLGSYDLYYLRDKMKREVDFLVMRDKKPWFLVEAKSSPSKNLSPGLCYFANLLDVEHAFQVDINGEFVERDCFSVGKPIKVPAKTLFSQLM